MPAGVSRDRLEAACATARHSLLDELTPGGHWVGQLSTSALSTATAIMALEMVRRHGRDSCEGRSLAGLISNGLNWLAEHQNGDGGWGDTVKSLSNISTTMLCRAVFVATDQTAPFQNVVNGADGYIDRAGGVSAVLARYGRDRTFSVPILTHCALAGEVAWSDVMPLPFELACIPASLYKTVRLPVVSYALPALIAIGQVRHHFRPTWNPVSRLLRAFAKKPSLGVLEQIQPINGGFLEATPLTSFVTMSLAAMELVDHPVAQRGVQFIVQSVREDGSWPIDTNLATWVTTLAVNALEDDLPEEHREPILKWLLHQQYSSVHPYTNADPGGWAWTDLPGGVPDADDTAGAILAVLNLTERGKKRAPAPDADSDAGSHHPTECMHIGGSREAQACVDAAVDWLLDLQNKDGGIPTFCRGWGALPFDRSSCDISAHVARAFQRWARYTHPWSQGANDSRYGRTCNATEAILQFLERSQREDGSWLPLWFGNQHAPDDENATYGTARAILVYRDLGLIERLPTMEQEVSPGVLLPPSVEGQDPARPAYRGLDWLQSVQNPDGGWGSGVGTPSTVEETAIAIEALLADPARQKPARRALTWLVERVEDGTWREPAPIGFYFARLWYFERLYPLIFTVGALREARRMMQFDAKPAD